MKTKKIQLALLVLMTSGFSAMYAPGGARVVDTVSGPKEPGGPRDTMGGRDSTPREGTPPEVVRGGDGMGSGRDSTLEPTAPVGLTPAQQLAQQKAQLQALSDIGNQFTVVSSAIGSGSKQITQVANQEGVSGAQSTLANVSTSVTTLQKALNLGDITILRDQLTALNQSAKSLTGMRDTIKRAGGDVKDLNTIISNIKGLQDRVTTYVKTYGDMANRNLAETALSSLEKSLNAAGGGDPISIRLALEQLADTAPLDYLQSNASRIADVFTKMQNSNQRVYSLNAPSIALIRAGIALPKKSLAVIGNNTKAFSATTSNAVVNLFRWLWSLLAKKATVTDTTVQNTTSMPTDVSGQLVDAMTRDMATDAQTIQTYAGLKTDPTVGQVAGLQGVMRTIMARKDLIQSLRDTAQSLQGNDEQTQIAKEKLDDVCTNLSTQVDPYIGEVFRTAPDVVIDMVRSGGSSNASLTNYLSKNLVMANYLLKQRISSLGRDVQPTLPSAGKITNAQMNTVVSQLEKIAQVAADTRFMKDRFNSADITETFDTLRQYYSVADLALYRKQLSGNSRATVLLKNIDSALNVY